MVAAMATIGRSNPSKGRPYRLVRVSPSRAKTGFFYLSRM